MRVMPEWDFRDAPEADTATRRDLARFVVLWDDDAGNDATCEDPPSLAHAIDAWARHASAANGCGGAGVVERPSSHALHEAARVHRPASLGGAIGSVTRRIAAYVSHARSRWQQRERAQEIRTLLRDLDDRTLRDLGFHRSEIESVAAEATGAAEATRMRTRWLAHS